MSLARTLKQSCTTTRGLFQPPKADLRTQTDQKSEICVTRKKIITLEDLSCPVTTLERDV